ncbi:MAG: hypothetical protein IIC22_07805 [Chloroflexi bacterium]|nr:hypothetical protein [Chloroflexota bacterium]
MNAMRISVHPRTANAAVSVHLAPRRSIIGPTNIATTPPMSVPISVEPENMVRDHWNSSVMGFMNTPRTG